MIGIKEALWDFLLIGLPCFIAGMIVMFAIFAEAKNEQDEKRSKTRKKRIDYIYYLIDLLMKKRREQSKIDVD